MDEIKNGDKILNPRWFKKIIIMATVLDILFICLGIESPSHKPIVDNYPGFLLLGSIVFYPIYFIILSVRYLIERDKMDFLDKIMFYFLLILALGTLILEIIIAR
jgi:hypothetical protein